MVRFGRGILAIAAVVALGGAMKYCLDNDVLGQIKRRLAGGY